MSKSIFRSVLVGAALMAAAGNHRPLQAQPHEPNDERRAVEEQVRAMDHELQMLHDRMGKAEEEGRGDEVRELQRHIESLHEVMQDRRRAIENQEREHHEAGPDSDRGREDAHHRIESLHQAAERVAQAGLMDLAHELHQRAQAIERELAEHHPPHSPHEQHHEGGPGPEVREVFEQIHALREEVRQLNHKTDRILELLQQRPPMPPRSQPLQLFRPERPRPDQEPRIQRPGRDNDESQSRPDRAPGEHRPERPAEPAERPQLRRDRENDNRERNDQAASLRPVVY